MSRIVVTGGAGFIGSRLVRRLAPGHELLVIDDLSAPRAVRPTPTVTLRFQQLDIRSYAIEPWLAQFHPDAVIHAAARTSVISSMEAPRDDAEVNVLGTLNLISALRGSHARCIYLNTGGALYDEAAPRPWAETTPLQPRSGYGLSKLTAEAYLRLFLPEATFTSLRLANAYGLHGGVVSDFVLSALTGTTPIIYGGGEQTRDFVFVDDVVEAIVGALDGPPGIFNVCSGIERSVAEVLHEVATVLAVPLRASYVPARHGEYIYSGLSPALAASELGWSATTTLAEGIHKIAREQNEALRVCSPPR